MCDKDTFSLQGNDSQHTWYRQRAAWHACARQWREYQHAALKLFSHLVQWNTIVMLSIEGSNLSVGYGKAGRVKLQQAAASAPGATAARAKSAQMQPVAERAIERSKRMADLNQEFSPCCQKARRAAEGGRSKQGLFEPHSRCSSDALAGKLQVE